MDVDQNVNVSDSDNTFHTKERENVWVQTGMLWVQTSMIVWVRTSMLWVETSMSGWFQTIMLWVDTSMLWVEPSMFLPFYEARVLGPGPGRARALLKTMPRRDSFVKNGCI